MGSPLALVNPASAPTSSASTVRSIGKINTFGLEERSDSLLNCLGVPLVVAFVDLGELSDNLTSGPLIRRRVEDRITLFPEAFDLL